MLGLLRYSDRILGDHVGFNALSEAPRGPTPGSFACAVPGVKHCRQLRARRPPR